MKQFAGTFLLTLALCSPGFPAQQTSPTTPHGNAKDVPRQQPGTESPDVAKQRKDNPPAPGSSSSKRDDVPQQQPGTDNPDIAKPRPSENSDSSSTAQTNKSKKKSKNKKSTSSASTSY